jgi:hypothetical protein
MVARQFVLRAFLRPGLQGRNEFARLIFAGNIELRLRLIIVVAFLITTDREFRRTVIFLPVIPVLVLEQHGSPRALSQNNLIQFLNLFQLSFGVTNGQFVNS